LSSLIIIVAMFALLWLLLIRPQRQAQAKRERMVSEVDVGDEILSSGGLYGTVRGVGDDADELFVEIAPGLEVRMDRRAVGAVVETADDEDEVVDAAEAAAEDDAADEPLALEEPEPELESEAHGTTRRERG